MQEPKLFQLLFMHEQVNIPDIQGVLPMIDESYQRIVQSIQESYHLDEALSIKLYQHLWIYTQDVYKRQDSHNETNRSKAIVKAIIDLTHSLDLSVVVEGVETKQEVDFLNEIQAYIIQGYYFSRPLMEDDFITLYINTNQNK